jgi:hypothetical protein
MQELVVPKSIPKILAIIVVFLVFEFQLAGGPAVFLSPPLHELDQDCFSKTYEDHPVKSTSKSPPFVTP